MSRLLKFTAAQARDWYEFKSGRQPKWLQPASTTLLGAFMGAQIYIFKLITSIYADYIQVFASRRGAKFLFSPSNAVLQITIANQFAN